MPFRALLLDLRNHGRSARAPGLHGPHTLAAAAQDVVRLWQHELGGAAPDLLIGHSMGGKTALEVVRQLAHPRAPTGQPKQVRHFSFLLMGALLTSALQRACHGNENALCDCLSVSMRSSLQPPCARSGCWMRGRMRCTAWMPRHQTCSACSAW